jgi:hypothetical protein
LTFCGAQGERGIKILPTEYPQGYVSSTDSIWDKNTGYPSILFPFDSVPYGFDQRIENESSNGVGQKLIQIIPNGCASGGEFNMDSLFKRISYIKVRDGFLKFQVYDYKPDTIQITQLYYDIYVKKLKLRIAFAKENSDLGGGPVNVSRNMSISKSKNKSMYVKNVLGKKTKHP